jgi:5-methyltetrahydropteroyltriglutamate--homocysteine methyltransferase
LRHANPGESMQRSEDRILTTHTGSLPLPEDVIELVRAQARHAVDDQAAFQQRLDEACRDIVAQQAQVGVDVPNDGEVAKTTWATYILERVEGIELRERTEPRRSPTRRDAAEFPEYFDKDLGKLLSQPQPVYTCVGPIRYRGHDALHADIARLKQALDGVPHEDAFMTAMTPATSEIFLQNEYYSNLEDLWGDLAEALRVEYEAITEAGFILQLDDPSLASMWNFHPEFTLEQFLAHEQASVEAMNHALRNVSPDRVRLHVCWGAVPGPHKHDIPLADILELLLKVNVGGYSVEASNPRHEHEWRVWADATVPDGTVIIPGVVTHKTEVVEHPRVVADRIVRYAEVVGRENVIAGTDCGLASFRIHPSLAWAKLDSLREGAALAGKELWG